MYSENANGVCVCERGTDHCPVLLLLLLSCYLHWRPAVAGVLKAAHLQLSIPLPSYWERKLEMTL